MPIGGEVIAVNEDLADAPELINEDSYMHWIIEIKPADMSELDDLLSVDAYRELTQRIKSCAICLILTRRLLQCWR